MSWYENALPSDPIHQGDLLFNMPIYAFKSLCKIDNANDVSAILDIAYADLIVLSQECDLYYRKVRNVLMCLHYDLSEFLLQWEANEKSKGMNTTEKAKSRYLEKLERGTFKHLCLLNPSDDGAMNHRVVDYHDVYTLPLAFIEDWLIKNNNKRLHLVVPYRETVSAGFSRYIDRIGLPEPLVAVSKAK